ncbi:hypothetical protein BHM03_00022058 [Ensete ventricosum]|uniref:Uncharacterized protein n=1 Tax=Ensete ventricosum TaxID=4639 RepID=A0A445MG53_ENSVE|nr:hypothetical protein BHM03_00022058 [Ensete ventricosum]
MRAMYHRGRSQITSTSESHGGDLIIQRYDRSGWIVIERGEEATTSPEGLIYPKSKVSVRKEVDLEERHSTAEADLPIAKKGMQM